MDRASHPTPTLVLLAAGVGRRFGGLKQLVPVGPAGEAILDYTVHDARAAGFGRVVLVVRKETERAFREHLGRTVTGHAPIELVHQELEDLPPGHAVPPGRARPWGTGHAVLTAAPVLGDAPFAVANADDLYGPEAWTALGAAVGTAAGNPPTWHMVGFRLGNTLPPAGTVSRALCRQTDEGWLEDLEEILELRREGDRGRWRNAAGEPRSAPADSLVSMNLWGFTADLLPRLEEAFARFLAESPGTDRELLLPAVVGDAIRSGRARVRVVPSPSPWCGITSPEDLEAVRSRVAAMIRDGLYPPDLSR